MSSNVSLPVPSPTIPVAGFKDVYDTAAVERALQDLPASANEALRALYEKMLRLGGQRFAVKPSGKRLATKIKSFRRCKDDESEGDCAPLAVLE